MNTGIFQDRAVSPTGAWRCIIGCAGSPCSALFPGCGCSVVRVEPCGCPATCDGRSLRADGEHVADDEHPDHKHWIDRRSAEW